MLTVDEMRDEQADVYIRAVRAGAGFEIAVLAAREGFRAGWDAAVRSIRGSSSLTMITRQARLELAAERMLDYWADATRVEYREKYYPNTRFGLGSTSIPEKEKDYVFDLLRAALSGSET